MNLAQLVSWPLTKTPTFFSKLTLITLILTLRALLLFFFFQWCFVLGALFVITAGVWFYFITKSNRVMTYPATVLLGFGFSAMLVNALSFAAELIGDNKVSSLI